MSRTDCCTRLAPWHPSVVLPPHLSTQRLWAHQSTSNIQDPPHQTPSNQPKGSRTSPTHNVAIMCCFTHAYQAWGCSTLLILWPGQRAGTLGTKVGDGLLHYNLKQLPTSSVYITGGGVSATLESEHLWMPLLGVNKRSFAPHHLHQLALSISGFGSF